MDAPDYSAFPYTNDHSWQDRSTLSNCCHILTDIPFSNILLSLIQPTYSCWTRYSECTGWISCILEWTFPLAYPCAQKSSLEGSSWSQSKVEIAQPGGQDSPQTGLSTHTHTLFWKHFCSSQPRASLWAGGAPPGLPLSTLRIYSFLFLASWNLTSFQTHLKYKSLSSLHQCSSAGLPAHSQYTPRSWQWPTSSLLGHLPSTPPTRFFPMIWPSWPFLGPARWSVLGALPADSCLASPSALRSLLIITLLSNSALLEGTNQITVSRLCYRGASVGQSVGCLPLARVMVSRSWNWDPCQTPCLVGSLLLPLPLPLPLSPLPTCALCSFSCSLSKKNSFF